MFCSCFFHVFFCFFFFFFFFWFLSHTHRPWAAAAAAPSWPSQMEDPRRTTGAAPRWPAYFAGGNCPFWKKPNTKKLKILFVQFQLIKRSPKNWHMNSKSSLKIAGQLSDLFEELWPESLHVYHRRVSLAHLKGSHPDALQFQLEKLLPPSP